VVVANRQLAITALLKINFHALNLNNISLKQFIKLLAYFCKKKDDS